MEPVGRDVLELGGLLTARAQERQAAVARNRVKPWLERDLALAATLEIAEGRRERVLDGVLGFLRGTEHVPAESQDAAAVAFEGDLEGAFIAAPDLLDQPLVPSKGEQTLRAERSGRLPRGECITHENAIGGRRFRHYFTNLPLRPAF